MDCARKFYETVLDIRLEKLNGPDPDLEMWAFPMSNDKGGAGGALCKVTGVPSGGSMMVYFGCDDCEVAAQRVDQAGGKLEKPKSDPAGSATVQWPSILAGTCSVFIP